MNLSFQKTFYSIAIVFAIFAILIFAQPILVPLSVSLLMSFILLPLAKKFESWRINRIPAVFLSIFAVTIIVGGVIYFFSTQIINLSEEFSMFKEKILGVFADVTLYANNNLKFVPNLGKYEITDQIKSWVNNSAGSLLSKTFNSTASIIAGLLITIVFTFLLLIYRKGLTQAFVLFFPKDKRATALKMFKNVQQVGQKYLLGMATIILILGFVDSIGLWIIGIDNPFLFGFLAAFLAIIPYVGTVLGASIPVLYAFVTFESTWPAVAVAIFFWGVQVIENNILTPKIVGGRLKVNALIAILSIITGASVWGVAGMILFLPFASMLKVVCEEYEELKPIALLIGDQNDDEKVVRRKDVVVRWLKKIRGWFSKSHNGKSHGGTKPGRGSKKNFISAR